MSSTPSSQTSSQTYVDNHPNNLTSFNINDLPPMTFPPLPPVTNQKLYDIVTSHSSIYTYQKSSMDLYPTRMVEDYEKLEHVGDALLGAMVTTLLHDLFPYLGEGPATTLKGCLVSNATLARISDAYEIPDKLQASPSALRLTRKQVKTKASMFEAWIAGVYYSVLDAPATIGAVDEEGYEAGDEGPPDVDDDVQVGEPRERLETAVSGELDEEVNNRVDPTEEPERAGDPSSTGVDKVSVVADAPTEDPVASVSGCQSAVNFDPDVDLCPPSNGLSSTRDTASPPAEPYTEPPTLPTTIEEPDDEISQGAGDDSESPASATVTVAEAHQELSVLTNDNLKYRWLAMIALDEWLRPLFTPIAHYALAELRKERARLSLLPRPKTGKLVLDPLVVAENLTAAGALPILYQHAQQAKLSVRFEHEQVVEGWRVVCTLTLLDESVVTGEGIRGNQKTAKALAAHIVCQQLNI